MVTLLATNKYNMKSLRILLSGAHPRLRLLSWGAALTLMPLSGAAPLGPSLVQAVHNKLKSVGANTALLQGWPTVILVPLFSNSPASHVGYGLTETSPVAHLLPHDKFLSKVGSVGVLLPNLEARLIGENGLDVKTGEPGELWLRGPTVMKVRAHEGRSFELI